MRRQQWTSVTIEFVIVVLGVFIGLQANEWGASQAAQRRGQDYAQRLIHDLDKDLRVRRELAAYYDAVDDGAERTNTLLGRPAHDPTALVVNAYRATEYLYTAPTRSTWDEVVSSGDIGLLPRAAVDDLSDYFAFDNARSVLDVLRASSYRRRVRSILSHEVQQAIREGCSDVRGQTERIVGFRQNCTLSLTSHEIADAAEALQRDPGVRSDLRYQFSEITTARANLRGDIAHLERALAALRAASHR
ncbi:MAG: hypothetical protein HY054_11815 [Proteobacteria bacterium]|nr:hypothetical protein [Pseudomonadota bacterium]